MNLEQPPRKLHKYFGCGIQAKAKWSCVFGFGNKRLVEENKIELNLKQY